MINSKENLKQIQKNLEVKYPIVKSPLIHRNSFQLLIATILSAQCTDNQINKVTPKLFKKFGSPEKLAEASLKDIEDIIYSTGFYKNKAKNIKECCRMLIDKYDGKVPETMEGLLTLPGVGRKTANVVLSNFFDISGIVVDTHVLRISKRLGFTESSSPEKVEKDLMDILDKKYWYEFSLRLIFFGREICTSRNPKCSSCFLKDLCVYEKESYSNFKRRL